MMELGPKELIKEKLRNYPAVQYEEGDGYIGIKPSDANGFPVLLSIYGKQITIAALGWHEHFHDFEAALNRLAFLLSEDARLKVRYKGNVASKYTLQHREGSEWVDESEAGTFLYPFWAKEKIVYLQNNFISE